MAMDERDRERRLERRAGRRIALGAVVGSIVGGLLGLAAGVIVFRPWTGAALAMALAGAILGGGIASVVGGLAGLESVGPGREPLERDEPVDDGAWTSTEHDRRA